MCVIDYKPNNINFPSDSILKNCYDNNPDGAGFMYAYKGKVYIRKGYTSWESFKGALYRAREKTGDNVPYVMHFRIATQGFEKTMTHPFPLSSVMNNLKKTKTECNIGVAHNGVLSLTSDGAKTYSDTMKFITDYLSLIIRSFTWHKDERTKQLIENLIEGSRLAILDKNGHCELMGKGWEENEGVHYSNNSYSYKKMKYSWVGWDNDFWNDDKFTQKQWVDPYLQNYDEKTDTYKFKESNCPLTMEDDDGYCCMCQNYGKCKYIQSCVGWK